MGNVKQAIRKIKHAAFLSNKKANRVAISARYRMYDSIGPLYTTMRPYRFDASRYRRSFLVRNVAPEAGRESVVPRRVFAVWTGRNPLTPARVASLDKLRTTLGVPVELVTPENLHEWIIEDHPLHPCYEWLSLVHRSDYLRAYLLHHHGGGYVDIKEPISDWVGVFSMMEESPNVWLAGYPEISSSAPARVPGELGREILKHHSRLVGLGALVARSHSPLTTEWIAEVERRLDYFLPQAREFPGGVRGEVVGYPISWTRVLGGILHPLMLKHLDHIRQRPEMLLSFTDYQ